MILYRFDVNLYGFGKIRKKMLVIFCSFSIIFYVFDHGIPTFILKDQFCFNEKFWKPVFRPFHHIFDFKFSERPARISRARPDYERFFRKFRLPPNFSTLPFFVNITVFQMINVWPEMPTTTVFCSNDQLFFD